MKYKSAFWKEPNWEILSQEEIDVLCDNDEWKAAFERYLEKKKKYYENAKKGERVEVLTRDEIDQLLTAINAGETEPDDFRPAADSRKIKIYDFKRPDKFNKEQIRTMSIMHETFARLTTTTLSAQLRAMVHVHVASVDQLTYEEFIRSIPCPTCLSIINMDPLRGNALLEIDPAIMFSIIDRICGGSGDGTKSQHEMTDIEQSIMEGIVVRMLGNLREAWTTVLDLRPRLGQMDTNPQFCQIVHPTEMGVLITFEVKVGEVEGMINIFVPSVTVEPLLGKMTAQFWYGYHVANGLAPKINNECFIDIDTIVKAEYFKTELSIDELNKILKNKGIITSEDWQPQYGKLMVDNTCIGIFDTDPKQKKNHKKVQLKEKYFKKEKDYMNEKNNVGRLDGGLKDIRVQISIELGRAVYSLDEINNFGEGSILELDKLAGEPVDIFANNVRIATGEVVVIDENYGVRICESFTRTDTDHRTFEERIEDETEE